MNKRRIFPLVLVLVVISMFVLSKDVKACGHDGFFIGAGYQQLFMYTPEDQLVGQQQLSSQHINFGPGFGAHVLFGYDFEGSRWGIQMPVGYDYFKLNHNEWTHHFDMAVEAILHVAHWPNGIDIAFVGGAGPSFLTEGKTSNNTAAVGVHAGIGPAFSFFFLDGETKGSIYLQFPIRMVHYFGNNLSSNGTTALQVPIRFGISFGGW